MSKKKLGADHPDTLVSMGNLADGDVADTASIAAVDAQLANSAVTKLRQSLDNATIYGQGWFRSGMPSLLKWLTSGSTTTEAEKLKPGVQDLIFSLLEETEARIDQEETSLRNSAAPSGTLELTRRSLHSALASWAERAHIELRGELETAFSSERRRLLAWWKLLWRVDDVGMVAEEVLSRRWLIEAEKEIIWLTGRIVESELNKAESGSQDVEIPSAPAAELNPESGLPRTLLDAPGRLPFSELTASDRSEDDQVPLPPLQSRAQSLLLQTLSTSALTSALATLLYLSSFSIYESGAVAALGLTWSLRRLQKWETAKWGWQEEVREEGRRAARETESCVGSFGEGRPEGQGVGPSPLILPLLLLLLLRGLALQVYDRPPPQQRELQSSPMQYPVSYLAQDAPPWSVVAGLQSGPRDGSEHCRLSDG
ncbi:MAG: hypothetical protein M1840_009070 [Geoglossum simile]|nr:MAG: hypothetical protein M1840_009070 [Geoglossum simile]